MATAGSGGRRSALLRGGECGSEGSTCATVLLASVAGFSPPRIVRAVASDDLDLVLGRLLASST